MLVGGWVHPSDTPLSYAGEVAEAPRPRLGLTQRRLAPARAETAERSLGRFVRSERWNGFESGDVVKVTDHPARGRHWRFRAHVVNTSNGASWVEVSLVEGPGPSRRPGADDALQEPGRVERVRSFAPDLVIPRWRRRGRASGGEQPAMF